MQWTTRLVEAHLAEAVGRFKCLTGSSEDAARMPSSEAIEQAPQPVRWLRCLDEDERRLVWDRASGMTWKSISHALDIDRSTAWRRWSYAIVKIVAHLNANNAAALLQHQEGLTSKGDGVD
jgi:hypothetical protein